MANSGDLLLWPAPAPAAPPDRQARQNALDVSRSWIVQAPAGAGKTELLTQRFLKLLAIVDEPEEILAITFTRAATAEMRSRILDALEQASRSPRTENGEPQAVTLARAALAHAKNLGWQLLEQPHRLDVQTIDSLCLRLAHGQPLLSRLGGKLSPVDDAAALYDLAAQRTLAQLGRAPAELESALEHLLLLRDNDLGDCRKLIANMLENRRQWQHIFVLSGHDAVDWNAVRAQLEAPFAEEVRRVLGELHAVLSAEPLLVDKLLELARYACANGSKSEFQMLDGLYALPAPEAAFVAHWTCLHHFLLTNKHWRKRFDRRSGFPTDGATLPVAEQRLYKQRAESMLHKLTTHRDSARLYSLLDAVPTLPAPTYDETQWQTLLSVFRVLRHAVAELHVVFAERNQVDFPELSVAAATVLDDRENPRGLLASEAKRHLLIDEFQDTSRHQHQLAGRLLREWQPGDGRTCFLVGDPMQSIYIFRQAEVELFGRVQRRGLDCGSHTHPCTSIALSENFRSHHGLVEPLNRHFTAIFNAPQSSRDDVKFAPSTAATPALTGINALQVHAFFADPRDPEGKAEARRQQVARVVALVEDELPRIAAARNRGGSPYRVAILGRAKNHLTPVAQALRDREIPFRAVELETLAERQEIIDLQSLLRALLHPMDRIAWLSVLRAPWCGLTLGDLHLLSGADNSLFASRSIQELVDERASLLSADAQQRLKRVADILKRAASVRVHSLAAWVERTWTSLGAPAYLKPEEHENAEAFFRLLDHFAPDGIDVLNGGLKIALEHLHAAPDASSSPDFGVELMTIHKAKGLGFEVVIVPSLERKPAMNDSPLVTMLERIRPDANDDQDDLLIAPLGARGEQHRTYKWVQKQRTAREAGERKRLFYVACTRARRQLHLLGVAEITASGVRPGAQESLLACAWPALGPMFEEKYKAAANEAPQPGLVERIAAAGKPPLQLERVPSGFVPKLPLGNVTAISTYPRMGAPAALKQRFARPEGSFEQRARGNAVHAMLELVSECWAREGFAAQPSRLTPQLQQLARSVLRRAGIAHARVEPLVAPLVVIVLTVASHAEGRWILSPHAAAQSEWSFSRWSGAGEDANRLSTMRVDRAFRAGDAPLKDGSGCLWIIDYKTGNQPGGIALEAYLESQKQLWQPQLKAYGAALRGFHRDAIELRYGLYFPELLRLKWWSD
jgi:ATP-dependent exoDNAse (exonuclease V) beta subunit